MKKKILIIEDDKIAVDIYKKTLEKINCELEIAMLGKDALERIIKIRDGKERKPDLILLDLILPDMNGLKILKAAKKENGIRDIPLLVLTNYVDMEIKNEAERLGADKYLIKTDIVPDQLINIITKEFLYNKRIFERRDVS